MEGRIKVPEYILIQTKCLEDTKIRLEWNTFPYSHISIRKDDENTFRFFKFYYYQQLRMYLQDTYNSEIPKVKNLITYLKYHGHYFYKKDGTKWQVRVIKLRNTCITHLIVTERFNFYRERFNNVIKQQNNQIDIRFEKNSRYRLFRFFCSSYSENKLLTPITFMEWQRESKPINYINGNEEIFIYFRKLK